MITKFIKISAVALTALLISTNVSFAQFGITAGANLSNIGGDNTDDNAMKTSFHAGLTYDLGITDHFFIQPGLIYSMKGAQSDSLSDFKFNTSYLEIPILAKYKLESGLNFFAGPYLGILMAAKFTDGTNDLDVKDQMESTDFGLKLGVGYQLGMGLGFNVHYELGLSNIYKNNDGTNTNSVIGIGVSYTLGGSK
jgi:hypothetical protein